MSFTCSITATHPHEERADARICGPRRPAYCRNQLARALGLMAVSVRFGCRRADRSPSGQRAKRKGTREKTASRAESPNHGVTRCSKLEDYLAVDAQAGARPRIRSDRETRKGWAGGRHPDHRGGDVDPSYGEDRLLSPTMRTRRDESRCPRSAGGRRTFRSGDLPGRPVLNVAAAHAGAGHSVGVDTASVRSASRGSGLSRIAILPEPARAVLGPRMTPAASPVNSRPHHLSAAPRGADGQRPRTAAWRGDEKPDAAFCVGVRVTRRILEVRRVHPLFEAFVRAARRRIGTRCSLSLCFVDARPCGALALRARTETTTRRQRVITWAVCFDGWPAFRCWPLHAISPTPRWRRCRPEGRPWRRRMGVTNRHSETLFERPDPHSCTARSARRQRPHFSK